MCYFLFFFFAPPDFCRSDATNASPGAQQHFSQPQGKGIHLGGIPTCCSPGQDTIPLRTALSPPWSQLVRTQPLQCIPACPPSQQKQKSRDKPRLTPLPGAPKQIPRHLPGRSAIQEGGIWCGLHPLHHLLSTAKWLAQKVGCFAGAGEFLCLQIQYLAAELCLVYGCEVALFLF